MYYFIFLLLLDFCTAVQLNLQIAFFIRWGDYRNDWENAEDKFSYEPVGSLVIEKRRYHRNAKNLFCIYLIDPYKGWLVDFG